MKSSFNANSLNVFNLLGLYNLSGLRNILVNIFYLKVKKIPNTSNGLVECKGYDDEKGDGIGKNDGGQGKN